MKVSGHPWGDTKLWRAWRKDSVERLSTTSSWIALIVAQVKRAPQALVDLCRLYFKLNRPKRSQNGGENGFVLSGGKSAISVVCGGWHSFRQMAQSLTSFLARPLPRPSQYFWRVSVSVLSQPGWNTFSSTYFIIRGEIWWFAGKIMQLSWSCAMFLCSCHDPAPCFCLV